jgi:hypothetical protein
LHLVRAHTVGVMRGPLRAVCELGTPLPWGGGGLCGE